MKYLKIYEQYFDLSEIVDECRDILLDLKDELFNISVLQANDSIIIFIDKNDDYFYYDDIVEHIKRLSIYIDSIKYRMNIYDSATNLLVIDNNKEHHENRSRHLFVEIIIWRALQQIN